MSDKTETFTAEERAAMKERAQELKAANRRGKAADKAAAEANDVVAKIAEMPDADRAIAERLHSIILANAPDIAPRLWYGMPAYAIDGNIVCFVQPAEKFNTRYTTFGFNDVAKLDDGTVWPSAYAITKLTTADEATLGELVKRAVS